MSEMGEKATGDDGRDFGCKGRKWEKIRPAGTISREVMRSEQQGKEVANATRATTIG